MSATSISIILSAVLLSCAIPVCGQEATPIAHQGRHLLREQEPDGRPRIHVGISSLVGGSKDDPVAEDALRERVLLSGEASGRIGSAVEGEEGGRAGYEPVNPLPKRVKEPDGALPWLSRHAGLSRPKVLQEEQRASGKWPQHPRVGGQPDPEKRPMGIPRRVAELVPSSVSPVVVTINTLIMAAITGLGAVPFFFVDVRVKGLIGVANSMAVGVMLAASFDLIHEGGLFGAALTIAGVVAGAVTIRILHNWLSQFEDITFQSLKGASARKTLIFVGIMAAHALGEGAGVGVSYCGQRGWLHGLLVTLAIGLHNIPEGLATATVCVGQGMTPWQAFLWTVFCALPQPLVAVPSFIFVDSFRMVLPFAMGVAAGMMLWITFSELLPDAVEDMDAGVVATVATFSAALLEGFRMVLGNLEDASEGTALFPGDVQLLLPLAGTLLPQCVSAGFAAGLASSLLSNPRALTALGTGSLLTSAGSLLLMTLTHSNLSLHANLALATLGGISAMQLWRSLVAGKPASLGSSGSSGALDMAEQGSGEIPDAASFSDGMHRSGSGSEPSWEAQRASTLQHRGAAALYQNGSGGARSDADTPKAWESEHGNGVADKPHFRAHTWGRPGRLDRLSAQQQRAMLLLLICVLLCEACHGLMLAAVAAASPAELALRLMLPAAVRALPVGLVAAGLSAGFLQRQHPRFSAAMGASAAAATACVACVAILLRPPTGFAYATGPDLDALLPYLSAFSSGATIVAAVLAYLQPTRGGAWLSGKGRMQWLLAGGGLVLGLNMVLSLMCAATPYCMSNAPASR